MKKILLSFLSLLFCLSVYAGNEFVGNDVFPVDRIIDARGCSRFEHDSPDFVNCINLGAVCNHKIIENPIGEFFGIKMNYPLFDKKTGKHNWVVKIVKSGIMDTAARLWCINAGVDIKGKRTLEEDLSSGKIEIR